MKNFKIIINKEINMTYTIIMFKDKQIINGKI